MSVTPRGRPLAGRPPAVLIPGVQGTTPSSPDGSLSLADVDDDRFLQKHSGQAGVAGEPPYGLRRDRRRKFHLARRSARHALKRLEGSRDLDARRLSTGHFLNERVGPPLFAGAVIVRA